MVAYWVVFGFAVLGAVAVNAAADAGRTAGPTAFRGDSPEYGFALAMMVAIMLSVFAGIRSQNSDGDYFNYVEWLNALASMRSWTDLLTKDPVFLLIGKGLRLPSGNLVLLMLAAAFASLLVKLRILRSREYAGLLGFGLLFLSARFFLLHEFTQVRAALGISLATLALVYSAEGQRSKGICVFILSSLVHLSVIGLAPLFLFSDRWSVRVKVVTTVVMSFVIAFLALRFGSGFVSEVIVRVLPYVTGEYETAENTLLSFYFVAKSLFVLFVWSRWYELGPGMRLAVVAASYGIILTVVFIDIAVLSLRLAELVSIFDCICFAYAFRWAYTREPLLTSGLAIALATVFYASTLGIVYDYEVVR